MDVGLGGVRQGRGRGVDRCMFVVASAHQNSGNKFRQQRASVGFHGTQSIIGSLKTLIDLIVKTLVLNTAACLLFSTLLKVPCCKDKRTSCLTLFEATVSQASKDRILKGRLRLHSLKVAHLTFKI